jgi:hypothetical protein
MNFNVPIRPERKKVTEEYDYTPALPYRFDPANTVPKVVRDNYITPSTAKPSVPRYDYSTPYKPYVYNAAGSVPYQLTVGIGKAMAARNNTSNILKPTPVASGGAAPAQKGGEKKLLFSYDRTKDQKFTKTMQQQLVEAGFQIKVDGK